MRFLAAEWLGLLNGDVRLRNARHANEAARELAQRLRNEAGIESVFPGGIECGVRPIGRSSRAGSTRARLAFL